MMLRMTAEPNDRSSSNRFYITYSFLPNFWAGICLEIAVDVLQRFPANCLP